MPAGVGLTSRSYWRFAMFIPETNPSRYDADDRSFGLTRRGFVVSSVGGAFIVGLTLRAKPAFAASGKLADVRGGDATPSLFVTIEPDGRVRITNHRSEMGQHITTAIAQIVADELEADWSRIVVEQAEGHPRYGSQNTDGSRSVRRNMYRLRVTGAAMRHQLERAAAKQWGVKVSACRAVNHEVVHKASGRKLGFGALAAEAARFDLPLEKDVSLKPRSAWRYMGHDVPSLTVPKIVRGQGTFGIDVKLDGMVHAVVARPPTVFGSVKKVDDTKAKAMPGVLGIVALDAPKPPAAFQPLGGIAVVADTTWAAIQGRKALAIEWTAGPNADYDSDAFAETMAATARQPGKTRRERGDVDGALEAANRTISAEYYVPHLAHSSMEPPVATARWTGDKVEIWACTQTPQTLRRTVAELCKVEPDDVTVHVTWLGGGFGRKSKPDFAVEAALVARQVGRPVKLTWTREDDLQHGYYHTVSYQRLEGGLDAEGRCTAFLHLECEATARILPFPAKDFECLRSAFAR
ncbi:MAG: molybdopterin cofactor-binding domain-containing protein [Myxococcota bacterium]